MKDATEWSKFYEGLFEGKNIGNGTGLSDYEEGLAWDAWKELIEAIRQEQREACAEAVYKVAVNKMPMKLECYIILKRAVLSAGKEE